MGRFKGMIITDKILDVKEMDEFVIRYAGEKFYTEFYLDILNPEREFDFLHYFGDYGQKKVIINKSGEETFSEKINNIDFEKCALDMSNHLYCIIDKYHFYEYKELKRCIEFDIEFHKEEIPNEVEIFKRIIESIKDKNKYLTIGIFHC